MTVPPRLIDEGGMTLAQGTALSLVMIGAGTAASLIVQLVLARLLGAPAYGTYQYVLGWLNIAVVIANFQLDVCAMRYVAEYSARASAGLLRGFLQVTRRIVARNALSLAALAALILWLLRGQIPGGQTSVALMACALLPLSALLNYDLGALQGLRRVTAAQLSFQVLRPVVFGIGVVAVAFSKTTSMTPALAVGLNGLGVVAALIVMEGALRRGVAPIVRSGSLEVHRTEWLRTARGFMIIAIAQFVVSQQSDVLVAGTLISRDAAGIYGAASQASSIIALAVSAVTFLGAPMITTSYAGGDHGALEKVVRHYGRLNLMLAVPIAVVLLVAGKPLLGLYGAPFVAGYPALVLLVLGQLLSAVIATQGGFLLTMTGRERLAARIVATSAGLNLVFTIVLTPLFGITGTALATLAATVYRVCALLLAAKRELRVSLLS